MHVFYLHGFASSPQSSKAAFLAAKFREHGVPFDTPDLNLPDFRTLTISRMVRQVGEVVDTLDDEEIVLIGSSLGAFVAVQVAVSRPGRIAAMILLAPALDFGGNRMRTLGETGIDEWERAGELNVFHYGYGRMMPVHYDLYADARRFDSMNAQLSMPIQVFQGTRDDTVDPATVERWAAGRPNVELHMLDDTHQLTDSLGYIWQEVERFLRLR